MANVVKINRVEKILEAVAAGTKIEDAIKATDGISQGTFYKRLAVDEELNAEYKLAQKAGSYAMHDRVRDMGIQALDGELPGDCKNHNVPKLGFEVVKWSTSRTNPTEFGDKPSVAIQVNLIDDLLGDSRSNSKNPLADIIEGN
ncbi:MAG: hypothetical protein V3T23_12400 [Nitrososphaerales archaeon]